MARKPLFRMTIKRKIILESIITTINMKIDHITGFARMLIEESTHLSEDDRKEKMKKSLEEEQTWNLVHDVLNAVVSHEDDLFLDLHWKEERSWRNEWDVPDDVFGQAINSSIGMLQWYHDRSTMFHMSPSQRQESNRKFEEKVQFLRLLEDFRLKKGEEE